MTTAALLIVLAQASPEAKAFDRAPGEIIDRLHQAHLQVKKEDWIDHFRCRLEVADDQGHVAAISVVAVKARKSEVRAACLSGGDEHACVATVWAELDPLSRRIYDPPSEPKKPSGPLRIRGAFYGGALFGHAHITSTEVNLGGMTYGNVDEYTDGAGFGGADVEKSWDHFGLVLGVGVVHQTATHAYTTMLPIATLARLRIPLPRCDFDQSGCVSVTASAGPLFWFGWVLGSGAAGFGIEGRLGLEWQMSRHLGGLFEIQGITGTAGTSDRHFESPSGAFVAGVTVR